MSISETLSGSGQDAQARGARAQKRARRFDAPALAGLEVLLIRLSRVLAALVVTLLLSGYYELVTGQWWADVWAVGFVVVCASAIMPVRVYKGFSSPDRKALRRVSSVLNGALVTLLVVAFTWIGQLQMLSPWYYLGLFIALALFTQVAGQHVTRYTRTWDRKLRLVIVGAGEQGVAIARYLTAREPEIVVIGFIDDRSSRIDASTLPFPLLAGGTAQLDLLPPDIDGVIIALPNQAGDRVSSLATRLRGEMGNVYLAPEEPVLGHPFLSRPHSGPGNMLLLGMNPLPIEGRLIKRLFDIVFSATVLLLFLPFGLVLAALIRLESPGPALFTQGRYGLRNRLFQIYKFRSMRFDPTPGEISLNQRQDARVTRIGNFIRRTSLDEFPQFINVLLGDMSVIGPRPHPPGVKAGDRTYEKVVVDFVERYKVRPGITGWAQVNGSRGNTFTEESLTERFVYDVQYIQNWSPELDLWIVIRTVFGGLGGKNAF
ncbi:exopolysaccharide biosynthesis polyprenyl glycosylphosphotransferase [Pseudomonas sp. ok272]|uniref:exopolysaccharide biosynthesis polyprenyl glycosylphosphotransferase n=1 Tax=unclassified Pseudomonas TaxID=196821 RepID=UPI0008BA9815|nr:MULTISPECIES: exopolysaccharide biosynthesis polyprenyl glycosylphosphotransferase [unclassified Pseudomonas]SEM87152.1 exopolysaccharide biosynthesis polyprenyl glycosylphosphotransferase [Pseudomonas sp. ok272]SFM76756.1 exopolysaccharide biosynthesis polyprenyl glycosylphosphotransferase [Pseudomonas sp. ok602]